MPDYPHHVTQRGNHRQDIFLCEDDYQMYLRLLRDHAKRFELRILSYCLMTNHEHLVAIPEQGDSLAKGLGRTHSDYAR
jgi:putative transposase